MSHFTVDFRAAAARFLRAREPRARLAFEVAGTALFAGVASRTMFNAAKDAVSSQSAQVWVNNLISRYGKVQGLKIDSRRKTLEVTCLLDGEAAPIAIRIGNYVVETDEGKKFIRATDFSCSRPWLQNLLADFGHRRRIELPSWAAAAL